MTPMEAVSTAKKYLAQLYEHENVVNVGLEELRFNDRVDVWEITLGFSRAWDSTVAEFPGSLAAIRNRPSRTRTYKVVRVNDSNGKVLEIVNGPLAA